MVLCCCAANNDNYKLQVRDWIIEGQDSLTDPGESMIDKGIAINILLFLFLCSLFFMIRSNSF